ncbi:hypothetical protein CYLTODRAFT_68541 [Cylindrobasidium torrendii FP15055 ss-10]|uniref:Secreted protein n=1 Tax=Cylindrobasidium torrendii FP15055 ss-10 TaxID=1314674 RepID=A0A0D7B3W2_9AGAR|nr:hypothetical protein CYLTODRAFT_68541 [Cylindrobasidium torrendii FP15055 ss-10]
MRRCWANVVYSALNVALSDLLILFHETHSISTTKRSYLRVHYLLLHRPTSRIRLRKKLRRMAIDRHSQGIAACRRQLKSSFKEQHAMAHT